MCGARRPAVPSPAEDGAGSGLRLDGGISARCERFPAPERRSRGAACVPETASGCRGAAPGGALAGFAGCCTTTRGQDGVAVPRAVSPVPSPMVSALWKMLRKPVCATAECFRGQSRGDGALAAGRPPQALLALLSGRVAGGAGEGRAGAADGRGPAQPRAQILSDGSGLG